MENPESQPTEQKLAPDFGPPPDWQSWPEYQKPTKPNRSRFKTALGGLALAGLLLVGGAATVFAADPSPSPSTSPNVTTPGTPGTNDGSNGGTTNGKHGPCLNMGGTAPGSGSGTDNGGTTTAPASPGSNT